MSHALHETDLAPDPFAQFARWFEAATATIRPEPNAMTLATADAAGRPSARIVLLKGVDDRGFVFFTNYESKKARDLAANPWAALTFYWGPLERQVRVEGRVVEVTPAESDAYFASRAPGSQLGAWASAQSSVIGSREILEQRLAEVTTRFGKGPIPRPPRWGGYRVIPDAVEFWQSRQNRLHDRLRYRREREGAPWIVERLSP